MAIHKVLGTETEYGIVVRGDIGFNPAVASSLVVNSYPGDRVKVQWSYEEESPGRDARGFGHDTFGVVDPEGAVVELGPRQRRPALRRPRPPRVLGTESYDPLEAALYDKVGEVVMRSASRAADRGGREEGLPLQEQLRWEGKLLRGPRELSAFHGRRRSAM